jgi:hypothetical protein
MYPDLFTGLLQIICDLFPVQLSELTAKILSRLVNYHHEDHIMKYLRLYKKIPNFSRHFMGIGFRFPTPIQVGFTLNNDCPFRCKDLFLHAS